MFNNKEYKIDISSIFYYYNLNISTKMYHLLYFGLTNFNNKLFIHNILVIFVNIYIIRIITYI